MTIRSRPILDRRHRPRWQDELRTQQLLVAAFAVAIALALGIFGASAWSGLWESRLRPVATVEDRSFSRGEVAAREIALEAELLAEGAELQRQLSGGPRDATIQQQIDAITAELSGLEAPATASLVEGAALRARAEDFGIEVAADEVAAAVAERRTLPESVQLASIVISALPDDAEPGVEPTDDQREAALAEAEAVLERLRAGEDFATVAQEVSDDFTGQLGGDLGWVQDEDLVYDEQFEAVRDAEVGDLIGPAQIDRGWAVIRLVARRPAAEDTVLVDVLGRSPGGEEAYRAFIADELVVERFQAYFGDEVASAPAEQRRVAHIFIAAGPETPVPEERARHVLIQPLPDQQDQATATEAQWSAALAEAQEVRGLLAAEDADWRAVAEERSDDPGSGARGGDLGWYDPAAPPFVPEFGVALAALEIGQLSEPVRTQFGYHVLQKTAERASPQAYAEELVTQLRADPDAFGELAMQVSEDPQTAGEGGEVGWVAPFQLPPEREDVIFAIPEEGAISDPVDLGTDGIYIYRLLEIDEDREVEADRLEAIRSAGFERWVEAAVTGELEIWTDPQFATADADDQGA